MIHMALVDWGDQQAPYDLYTQLRSTELLESAVDTPRQAYYLNVFQKAAALFRSIIVNHPFVDGNKRAATIALVIFLGDNGYHLKASQDQVVRFALSVARGHRDLHRIKSWIERHSRKIKVEKQRQAFRSIREALTALAKRVGFGRG